MPKLKIMLVDDEEDLVELLGARIKGWGYDFIGASCSKEAMELLISAKPDIVIVDYLLPDKDGVTLMKEIQEVNAKIPVIMFTAHPDSDVIKNSLRLNVTAFIPKLSLYSDINESLRGALSLIEKQLPKKP